MNIFVHELKANLKSLIIWGVIVMLFTVVGLSKFSAYYNNPEMLKLLDDLPQQMVEALNFRAFNLTTITGFLGVMYMYFSLLLSIAAAMWGSDIISKEESNKTVEFALTLPVSRNKLITAKILAAAVNCIALLLITGGVTAASAQKYQPDQDFYRFLGLIMVVVFIIQMIFMSVGIFLGCALKQFRRAGSAAVSILLVAYFLAIIVALNKNLEFLKYFTPFKYFDPVMLLNQSKIDILYVGLSALIIIACLAGGYLSYARRDLYI